MQISTIVDVVVRLLDLGVVFYIYESTPKAIKARIRYQSRKKNYSVDNMNRKIVCCLLSLERKSL